MNKTVSIMKKTLRDATDAMYKRRTRSRTEESEMVPEKAQPNLLESPKETNI